ncbi:unnamed protein product [Mytilus coruscus]|uniref:Uncharacterized protein n=1 Tax=Mytilus coruscus TaxID=42192 RepID=A0A6J8F047_MYTCO|nr:unnamed protein product [Mytilus coruscus]
MRGSDIDLMGVLKFIEVCENIHVPINHAKAYFTMDIDDSQPGFTRLRLIHCNNKFKVLEDCEEIGGEFYFSSIRIKRRFLNPFGLIIHGPCISDKFGIFDEAICLHEKSWITQAKQWLTRSNNAWPDYDVKHLKLMLSPLMYLANSSFRIDQSSWTKGVRPVLSIKSSHIKSIYSFYMANMCSDIDHLLPFDGINDNKSTYKQYKTCTSTLLMGTNHDAVCGWMKLASYFYRNDMYETAIYILQYSLLKCSPKKLYIGTNLSHINYEIFHLDLFIRMTIRSEFEAYQYTTSSICSFPSFSLSSSSLQYQQMSALSQRFTINYRRRAFHS